MYAGVLELARAAFGGWTKTSRPPAEFPIDGAVLGPMSECMCECVWFVIGDDNENLCEHNSKTQKKTTIYTAGLVYYTQNTKHQLRDTMQQKKRVEILCN